MVAVPAATPVASPCAPLVLLTVATAVVDDDHVAVAVMVCVELSAYVATAWNWIAVPLAIVGDAGVIAMDTTAGCWTVSGAVAVSPL